MRRATACLTALLLGLSFLSVAVAAAEPAPAALESKLHGVWVGGPCMGSITFRADGTFERKYYSPGNWSMQGTWSVRWDALPPTLVMKCTESDNQEWVGRTRELKLVELNDQHLGYIYPESKTAVQYERKP